MKRWKMASLSLVLGGTLFLMGCSLQFQAKRGVKTTGEVIEAPKPEVKEVVKAKPEVEEAVKAKPEVKKAVKAKEELVTTHTVVKGETLWDIAGYKGIYGDSTKWKRIYDANKDILSSPDALKPGQVLIIPRGEGNGKEDQGSLPGSSQ